LQRVPLYLILAILLAWGASLAGPFHFDDYNLFVDPLITSARGWYEVWRPIQTRPLSQFTFWLSYAISGTSPLAYHVWNLALHMLASVLVWRTLRLIIPERAAFVAAAIYAVHPMQAEPVNYVFARSSELSTVLCLVALELWLRERLWPAVVVFGAALLAKEECVTFPLFLAILDWRRGKRHSKAVAAMLALAFVLGMRVLIATKLVTASGGGFASHVTPVDYFTAQGVVIWRYLRLLIVPWGFAVDPEVHVVLPWVAWLCLALLVASAWRWVKGPGFWLAAGLVLLIPSSSVFPADDLAADRRMYLPMIAFCAALGLLAERLDWRILATLGVVLAGLSVQRTSVWNSERKLWEEAVERAPDKVRPRIQLARSLGPREGLEVLDAAARRFTNNFDIATERGRLLIASGRPGEALEAFGQALAIDPSSAMAMNNRGVALAALGQKDAAQADFERALKTDPCFEQASTNLQRLGFASPSGPPSCPH
jgi:hypothetical protein